MRVVESRRELIEEMKAASNPAKRARAIQRVTMTWRAGLLIVGGGRAREQKVCILRAGGRVRALAKHGSRWCGRVWVRDEVRGTVNSVLQVGYWSGGAGSS